MKGSDLAEATSRRTLLPIEQAKPMVEVFFAAVKEALRDRRRIEFRGFGSFVVRDYEASLGRNPGTGGVVLVGPRHKSVFRPSQLMIDRLRSGACSSGDKRSDLESVT